MSRGRGPCPAPRPSGKRPKRKLTREQAQARLVEAKIRRSLRGRLNRRERSAYPCPWCGWWHLSSWDERGAS